MLRKLALFAVLVLATLAAAPVAAQQRTAVTLLHFSDYHSHAVPFYSEGRADSAGIARLIAYLKSYADDPNTLIFSGGDMLNLGTPAWSDKYRCAEWPWLNGIVDAMAYGNHDADYGPDVFAQCQAQIDYPILSANVLDPSGQPLFLADGKPYAVFETGDVKIGVFAVAGPDFDRLIKPDLRPASGVTFGDRIATAREVVRVLREQEQVNAIALIGHALYEDDVALAQAVPGIDILFGTHSHRKAELQQIAGTTTYFISPFQYATYVSQVELQFEDGRLSGVSGELVPMTPDKPQDEATAQLVAQMQADLEADPQFSALFQPIGEAADELGTDGQFSGEALLGNFVMDIFRDTAKTHLALATASGFREPIPPGTIIEEEFRTAMPYKNRVLVYSMTGAQIQELLNYSISRSGSDFFSQVSGVRFGIVNGQADGIQILNDPANPAAGYAALDPAATYSVATSDFQGKIAGGYKDIFAKAPAPQDLGIEDIRTVVREYIRQNSPVSARLDGRIVQGALPPAPAAPSQPATPIQLPNTGGEQSTWLIGVLALVLVALGVRLRQASSS